MGETKSLYSLNLCSTSFFFCSYFTLGVGEAPTNCRWDESPKRKLLGPTKAGFYKPVCTCCHNRNSAKAWR